MEDIQKEILVDPEPEVVQDPKAALREKNRLKKRAQRSRDKAKKQLKEAAKLEASFETMDNSTWWTLNIKKDLTPKQLAEYTERDAEVLALEIQMEDVVFQHLDHIWDAKFYEDVRNELQSMNLWKPRELSVHQIEELKARVQADQDKNGTRLGGIEGLNFAQHRDRFDNWTAGNPGTITYVLYGFCTALDSKLYIAFRQATVEGGYVLRCQCGKTQRFRNSEPRPEGVWRCLDCAERSRKQAEVTQALDKIREQAVKEPDIIYDQFGRFKTGGTP